jgi:NhaP-type Na+/H+ or K+/H+ antiporter
VYNYAMGRITRTELYVALAVIGGLLLMLGMLAGLIHESGFLSEPLFALLAGVLIGPGAFDLLDLAGLPRMHLTSSKLFS